jgi:hypothetical protein
MARPLKGPVALAVGYNTTNASDALHRFLNRIEDLVKEVTRKTAGSVGTTEDRPIAAA